MTQGVSLDLSLERIVPDRLSEADATGQETFALHFARYQFARQFVGTGPVLDCACGVGYGSAHLADAESGPASVLGVDIDPAAVAHARRTYDAKKLSFRQGDGTTLKGDTAFQTIVSLETVEHVPDPVAMLTNFVTLLAPGGTLIASVPVTPSVDANPYHLHDFTASSFRAIGASLGLQEVASFGQDQPFNPFDIATGREKRLGDMRPNLASYYLANPSKAWLRLRSTVTHGFKNKYLTVAWSKPS